MVVYVFLFADKSQDQRSMGHLNTLKLGMFCTLSTNRHTQRKVTPGYACDRPPPPLIFFGRSPVPFARVHLLGPGAVVDQVGLTVSNMPILVAEDIYNTQEPAMLLTSTAQAKSTMLSFSVAS